MERDIEEALNEAWAVVEPKLRANADELALRLARRRSAMLTRYAPRPWCLAVRACDTRLTPMHIIMVPDSVGMWDARRQCRRIMEHEVTLDAECLAWLCRPVFIAKPGQPVREVMKMLGVRPDAIQGAIKRGQLAVHYVKGLGGVRGRPVPIVYTPKALDPAGLVFDRMNDYGWGTPSRWVSEDIPAGLCQTVLRRPIWKDDGRFNGWRWVCPCCHCHVRILYCPIPGPMAPFVNTQLAGSADAVETSPSTFACKSCHGVHDYGRSDARGWNDLVSYLSGGLLYGREVKRPEWWDEQRRREYRARPDLQTSKRRAQFTGLLVNTDLSRRQIALKLGLSLGCAQYWIWHTYKYHHVHSRAELRGALCSAGSEGKSAG